MIANRQDLKQGLLDAASWNTDQVMICATLRDASLVSAASDVPIANPRRKRLDFDEAYLSGFEWITRKKRFALADVRSVIRSRCGPDKRLRQRSPVRPLRVRPDRRGSRREFAGSLVLTRPQAEAALRTAIKDGRIRPWSGVDPSSGESFVDPSWFDRAKMVSLPLEPHRLPPGSHQSFKALAFQNLDSGVVLWLRFNPAEVLSVFPTKDEEGTASATPGSTREKPETAAAEQGQDTGRHGAAPDKPNEALVLASDGANAIASSWEIKEPRFQPEAGPAAPGSARENTETSAIEQGCREPDVHIEPLQGDREPKTQVADRALVATGMPGRPQLGRDLLLAEAERRLREGKSLPDKLRQFVKELLDWLASEHPTHQRPKYKSTENLLRGLYNQARPKP